MTDRRPMVVFLTHVLNGGGAERSLLEVFQALDRQRFNPLLWRLGALNEYPEYLAGVKATEVLPEPRDRQAAPEYARQVFAGLPAYLQAAGVRNLMTDALRIAERLKRLASTAKGPVILVGSQIGMNSCLAIVQWLTGDCIPMVFIEQNEPYVRYLIGENEKAKAQAWTRIRHTYPRATRVVAVSRAVKNSLSSRFGVEAHQIAVIPNPVNLDQVRAAATGQPRHLFYQGRAPVLICTARFFPQKNHAMLLRAFALARQKTPLKLLLLGQGDMRDMLERTILEMGLERDVAIVDFHPQPFAFVAHADLLVLASYGEGHSLALLEALACGVPVVSTNWAGVGEIIEQGKNGIICSMHDRALAEAILAGLKLAKSKKVAAYARASVERFATAKIAQKYEQLFDSILTHRTKTSTRRTRA
jgi:glycosyltransferase involved in cell wall biosynthesis